MKVIMSKIHYKVRCEMDGCRNMSDMGFSGVDQRPSARLHLCRDCVTQLAALGALESKPPISPGNIFKRAIKTKFIEPISKDREESANECNQ